MAFEAAKDFTAHTAHWRAVMRDLEQDMYDRATLNARAYDLYRNNDLVRGAVDKMVDTEIGQKVTLQSTPDYESLGVSRSEAVAWTKLVESEFDAYANSAECWISSDRTMTLTEVCRSATRMRILTGEAFLSREWRASPLGYKTCFQLISPDRVRNPTANATDNPVFHGIELDRYGTPVAYWVETARAGQKRQFGNKDVKRYSRYTAFGQLQLIHVFEPLMPEYPRGITRLASVMRLLKQRELFMEADLDKAILAAHYALAITSDMDAGSVAEMLAGHDITDIQGGSIDLGIGTGARPEEQKRAKEILKQILEDRYIDLKGAHVMHLFKGEQASVLAGPNTIGNASDYIAGYTKSIMNGTGISYEFGTGDFSGVNYSGGQLSLGIYEASARIQRNVYGHRVARCAYRAWLDEAIARGTVPLLGGVDYWADGAREKYARCSFGGAKAVHADPLKDARAASIALSTMTRTRSEIAESRGENFEDIVQLRQNEAVNIAKGAIAAAKEVGIELSQDDIKGIIVDAMTADGVSSVEPYQDSQSNDPSQIY